MRRRLPHLLVGSGLLVLLGVGLAVLLRGGGHHHPHAAPPPHTTAPAPPTTTAPAPPPTTTAPAPPTTTAPAPPATTTAPAPPTTTAPAPPPTTTAPAPPTTTAPPPGFAVNGLAVTALAPFSATVSWQTPQPSTAEVAWGLADGNPTLWIQSPVATQHEVTLPGLVYGTAYRVWVTARSGDEEAQATIDVQTPAPAGPATGSRSGEVMLVDGQPFFPLMIWSLCPNGYQPALLVGIDLFAEDPCGGLPEQLQALAGRALSAGVVGEQQADGPGLVGWFYEDEADAKGAVPDALGPVPSGVSLLTLSNHFYSGAAPLPQGRAIYPGLVAKADVVGFDLYPLQEWCRPDRIVDVYSAQRELVALAPGKPTFQWIEAGPMRCGDQAPVTPEVVRAESWLAIAGGAHGLGFFPSQWQPPIAQAIAQVTRDVRALTPALVAPAVPASASPAALRVAARAYGGALYVVAVNPMPTAMQATLRVPGLAGRQLQVLDEGRTVQATGARIVDAFAPLGVHVYVAAPASP